MTSDYLSSLNPEQLNAVETTDGAVLVLSGAGTGKTSVLIARIAYILAQGLAQPWQILALTFTNKAANEMKERLRGGNKNPKFKIPENINPSDIWCGTFHSISLRILRRNAASAGLRPDFLIYGEPEQERIVKTVLANLGLDAKDYPPAEWIEKISAQKDKGLTVVEDRKTKSTFDRIYSAYNDELARIGAVDFGDLILKTLELFANNPEILQKYQGQFKYVMVDEYQDTNAAQYQLVRMLAGGYGNICCVGDDDQSIYSWRGAEIKNILNFNKEYPDAEIIRLETNYRSTGAILYAANSLIKHNSGRLGKDLRPADGAGLGEKVRVLTLPTDLSEVKIIADAVADANGKFSDVAILIRAGSLSRLYEEEFAARGIPYRLVGAMKFYDRMEIRDAIAYIRLLAYPFDDLSFLRIISKPRRGFGDKKIADLRNAGGSLMPALRDAPLRAKQGESRDEFLRAFDFNWESMAPKDAALQLLENSGYLKMWRESKEPEAQDRLGNINDLLGNVISKYDSVQEFLEHASLMMTEDEQTPNGDAVNIMTIHAAKGLEFDTVFMPAWEEGIFPNEMAIGDGGLEEERRLAYVALTRARRHAVITNAMSRMVFGKREYNLPSRFIGEIDPKFIETRNAKCETRDSPTPRVTRHAFRVSSMVGKLVRHKELGQGVVIEENDDILTVAFANKGIKKIAKQFLLISD
ncbi:MAG: UvrD-helicase domain-containing protein [Alphaproteobacteria bacterium]|nr:UvrD-helicase domain-containing protein [Alphaproteobacteria bacterium]